MTLQKPTAEFIEYLRSILGKERVLTEGNDFVACSRDRSFHTASNPDVAVFPETIEEVQKIVRHCYEHRVPLTPRGAGTGLEGGAVPYHGGVVLSTSRLVSMKVLPEDGVAVVGPGVYKNQLNKFLKDYGLLFGPDPASNPSLGGMVSTSGSGMSTPMYGTTRENVVSLLVVTSEGKLLKTRQAVRKASTGYELTQVYIGSEGTLGVIVEITVKVRPIPKVRAGSLAVFRSVGDAAAAVVDMKHANLGSLMRCELLNTEMLQSTNRAYKTSLQESPTLFLEFQCNSREQTYSDMEVAQRLSKQRGLLNWRQSESEEELDEIWEARRGCYYTSQTHRGNRDDLVHITDVCVPISQLTACISETEADFQRRGFSCLICAHIQDGNFHTTIPYSPGDETRIADAEHAMIDRAIAMGGAVSGEHGVGIGKVKLIEQEHGPVHMELQRRIKNVLDPRGIMNPGKVLRYEQPKANL